MVYTSQIPQAIESLVDTDQYKMSEWYYKWYFHRHDVVTYELINRTKDVRLADLIPIEAVREQLDALRTLRFTTSELAFLQGTGLFVKTGREFIEKELRDFRFSEFEVEVRDGQYVVRSNDILSETLVLSTMNHLRTYFMMKKYGIKRTDLVNEAIRVLREKIDQLKCLPVGSVLEFGSRRRALAILQQILFELLQELVPGIVNATSNIKLSMLTGFANTGTHPHAGPLLEQGVALPFGDDAVRSSAMKFVDQWTSIMPYTSCVWLTDMYGHEAFFRDLNYQQAINSRGYRWDSGPWKEWTDMVVDFNHGLGINLTDRYSGKDAVYSDGLDPALMCEIFEYASPKFRKVLFGLGTNLTNDLGMYAKFCELKPISLVMKPTYVNGVPVVKLSANPAKVTGGSKDHQNRIARIFEYNSVAHQFVQPVV